jgi:hypothetical protein
MLANVEDDVGRLRGEELTILYIGRSSGRSSPLAPWEVEDLTVPRSPPCVVDFMPFECRCKEGWKSMR